MYICIYVYMYIYMHICIYVYMYICIYVYMYICIYVYYNIWVYIYNYNVLIYIYVYIIYIYICTAIYQYVINHIIANISPIKKFPAIPWFAHTQTTDPNNMIYWSPEDQWKLWLYAVFLTFNLGFWCLLFWKVKNQNPAQGFEHVKGSGESAAGKPRGCNEEI